MRRTFLIALAVAMSAALPGTAGAKPPPPPQTALILGDSLMRESEWEIAADVAASPGSSEVNESIPGTAPCDWIPALAGELAAVHPTVVTIATAGNSGTPCMDDPSTGVPWPINSPGYKARYQADLSTIFSMVSATGAETVFVKDPAMLDTTRNKAVAGIDSDAASLAKTIADVGVATKARTALGGATFTATLPCLADETAAEGCTAGEIAVRNPDGIHLCPVVFSVVCPVYSSGERRYGDAVAEQTLVPPKPGLKPR